MTLARWVPTAAWFSGMALLWMGQRALDGGTWSQVFSVVGIASALIADLALFGQSRASRGAERSFRARMAGLGLVGLIALVLWALQSEHAREFLPGDGEGLEVALSVLWPLVWLAGALPLLFMELSFVSMSRDAVEGWRLGASGRSAFVLVLVLGTLGFLNYIASELDWKRDWSYLRTTRPSESTLQAVENLNERLDIVLFYPPANEVAEVLLLYFEQLAAFSDRIRVRVVEHALEPTLSERYQVSGDGTVIFGLGSTKETLRLGLELGSAKSRLRSLDGDVQLALLELTREERVAYVTSGHGESNFVPSDEDRQAGRAGLREVRNVLERLNYRVERLGLLQGLGSEIPRDASIVLVVGPREAFLASELASLHTYLERGGRLLVCVDPEDAAKLQPLLALTGVSMSTGLLANDRYYIPDRNNESDHFFLFTNRFSRHASVSTLRRYSDQFAVILPRVGQLEEVAEGNGARVSFVIRSLPDTWLEVERNGHFDEETETRAIRDLAAAVEAGGVKDSAFDEEPSAAPDGWRAVVFADADWLTDGYVRHPGNAQAFFDVVSWLQGDKGARVEVEQDVPLVHTREQDVSWFYGTIFAPPLFVVGAGLWWLRRRRRRPL
jgi:hypothetical protein